MNNNAAIMYVGDDYHTAKKSRIMGRHSANEGFLSAFARHMNIEEAYSYVFAEAEHRAFAGQYQAEKGRARRIIGVTQSNPEHLARAGCLYVPDPGLARQAYIRQMIAAEQPEKLYSLCGITHTISSEGAMALLRDLVTAPLHPWDALICTSHAVRDAVEQILSLQADYLSRRLGHDLGHLPCQMPVIPLGVHTTAFATGATRETLRMRWRERLRITDDSIAFLFFGRLSFHAKANPFPMLVALERVAQQTGKSIHLILAGQFASEGIANSFQQAGESLCPSVKVHVVDGGDTAVRSEIWYAADVFTSLVDNIQETFGLTPVEAMAAGLPVVVTDWDGYRDTVEHGAQGFLVPTVMPRANGIGLELAKRFFQHMDNYDYYIANAANYVAVDVDATTACYLELAQNHELRERMGQAARARAETVYDWKHIIHRYQSLWAELAEIRQETQPRVMPRLAKPEIPANNPLAPDPFYIFKGYPTRTLQADVPLELVTEDAFSQLQAYLKLGIVSVGLKEPELLYKAVIEQFAKSPSLTLGALLENFESSRQPLAERCVARLMKLGLLRFRQLT